MILKNFSKINNTSLVPDFIRNMDQNGMGKLALVDADGTLWHHDAADDFTKWMIKNKIISGGKWNDYVNIFREDPEKGCQYLLRLYKGLPVEKFRKYSDIWWLYYAHRNWISEVIETLFYLAGKNYFIWLVTGSPTEIIRPVQKILPIQKIIGMDFETVEINGHSIITGNLSGISSTNRGKVDKVLLFSQNRSIEFCAGNSSLDREMIQISRNVRWCIHPDDKLRKYADRHNWHILERPSGFIEEDKLRIANEIN